MRGLTSSIALDEMFGHSLHPVADDLSKGVKSFQANKYVVVRRLVDHPLIGAIKRYAKVRAGSGTPQGDKDIPGTPSFYADPIMEELLGRLVKPVGTIVGLPLVPTYSYFRVYKHGDVLKRHKDRVACEVSVSLCAGVEGSSPWVLWVQGMSGPTGIELAQGDAVLYRGTEVEHWRTQFEGDRAVQVFLHYVDENGPCAEWRFDRRSNLNDIAHHKSGYRLLQAFLTLAVRDTRVLR